MTKISMGNYVDNKRLYNEIIESKKQDKLTLDALMMLTSMIQGISKIFKYKIEEDREDCQAFAMEDVLKYWNRFDPEKSNNAFAFYTQMIKNAYAKGWKKLYPIKSSRKISISKDHGVYNF